MKTTTVHFALAAVSLMTACHGEEPAPHPRKHRIEEVPAASAQGVEIDPGKLALYGALPSVMESKANPVTDEKIALGRMLFYDSRLSKDHDVSCNTCHDLDRYGIDGKDIPIGHKGQKGRRNTPTVYNAALQFAEGWDGRAETVEDQAKAHELNPGDMAMPNAARAVEALKSAPGYVDAFKKAFPDEDDAVTFENLAKAIGAFERKLSTPSKWDQFLAGDKAALTDEEKKGFLKFVDVGCVACHTGPLVGGTMYQKLGLVKPWPNQKDRGRAEVTKSPSDELMFKASQLRNIDHTAPYFHDGSAKTLEEAVKVMAAYQLNKELGDDDVRSIVTWLKSLSGPIPADCIKKPDLPEPGPGTPKSK
jgi:cytochrome c peroxidase